jgi:hypothetical protein
MGPGIGGGKTGMGGSIGMAMQKPMPVPMMGHGVPNKGMKTMPPMQMMGRPPMQQTQPMPQPNGLQNLLAQQQWQQQQAIVQQQMQLAQQRANLLQQPATDEQMQAFLRSQSDATLKKALGTSNLYMRLLVAEELKRRKASVETASFSK